MAGDGRLRIGGWVSAAAATRNAPDDSTARPGDDRDTAATGDQGQWGGGPTRGDAEDGPEGHREVTGNGRWEAALAAAAADGDGDGSYRGQRRMLDRLTTRGRRMLLVAAAGGLLLGAASVVAGVLGSTEPLAPQATSPAAPPDPAAVPGNLGAAPNAPTDPPTAPPTPSQPSAVSLSFEVEAGQLGSHGQVVTLDDASGGQAVRLSGNREGTFVQLPEVDVAATGAYQLTIFYLSEQDRTATVAVGDAAAESVSLPSRSETGTFGAVTVTVQLSAGGNAIVIATPGGAPVYLDRVTVTG